MKLNSRSEKNLVGVHEHLIRVVRHAAEITSVNFIVTEGVRTVKRQKELVAKGASQTMMSRHIIENNKSGFACAVDLAAVVGSEVRWDWPLYERLAVAMKMSAKIIGVPIEWGGDWTSFRDGPHFQLPWTTYP